MLTTAVKHITATGQLIFNLSYKCLLQYLWVRLTIYRCAFWSNGLLFNVYSGMALPVLSTTVLLRDILLIWNYYFLEKIKQLCDCFPDNQNILKSVVLVNFFYNCNWFHTEQHQIVQHSIEKNCALHDIFINCLLYNSWMWKFHSETDFLFKI